MKKLERIPLHDHVDRNSGGPLDRATVARAAGITASGGGGGSEGGGGGGGETGPPGADGALPWFNVTDVAYGAVEDNTTDCQSAVNGAITALNAAGGGVLYFPGTGVGYLTTGAFNAITVPCLILGDLQGMQDGSATASRINCTSQTAVLFTINARLARFEKIHLVNTYAGNASAGAAVACIGPDFRQKVDFEAVTISDFYIGVDVQTGEAWVMNNTYIEDCVLYDLKIRNTDVADVGDWKISNSVFGQNDRTATAAIRIESSGGGKIVNCKINSGTNHHTYGIQMVPASTTSILLISNCSLENTSSNAIRLEAGSARWPYIVISGNQFGMYQTTNPAILLDNYQGVVISDNIIKYGSAAAAAISFTDVTSCYLTHNVTLGATALVTASTSTYIEDSGGIANGVQVSGTPTSGQVPTATGATTATWQTPSSAPSGSAGGDLSGTYPNPSVVDDSHNHTGATVTGISGTATYLVISDTPSTPLVFADILQNEAEDDFIYSD